MKKNYKSNKKLNATYRGYVLYDTDLKPDFFKECLTTVIDLHDVFSIDLSQKPMATKTFEYTFEEIHTLDQISFMSELNTHLKSKQLSKPAEIKLIYFNNNLRGFYFNLNRVLFDEASIKKFIVSLEKQYFKNKSKQSGTSFIKWMEHNQMDEKALYVNGKYEANHKILTFDEQLTKRIHQYIKQEEMTLFQFMSGVICTYFKVSKQKDVNFTTNAFDDENGTIGNLKTKRSYVLKKNPNVELKKYIKNDWIEQEKYAQVSIVSEDRFQDTKGSVYLLNTADIIPEIEFRLREHDWEIELLIAFQKYAFKKDDIYLMLNKLRMIVFKVLENDQEKIQDMILLTRKEIDNGLNLSEVNEESNLKNIYEQFINSRVKFADNIAIKEGPTELTYQKLSAVVAKMSKALEGVKSGDTVSVDDASFIQQIAAILAIDHVGAVYSKTDASWVIKKGLFGYKAKKVGTSNYVDAQYCLEDAIITKMGYLNYCKWMQNHFALSSSDKILVQSEFDLAIPGLLSGATVVVGSADLIDQEKITVTTLKSNEVKSYNTLKHAIVDDYIKNEVAYKLHLAFKIKNAIPYVLMGPLNKGRLTYLRTIDGIGVLVLNKNDGLTQAFEKGTIHVYGSGVGQQKEKKVVQINGQSFTDVYKSELKAKWFADGNIRI